MKIINMSLIFFLLTSVFVSASNFTNIEKNRSFKLSPPIDLETNGILVDLSGIQEWELQILKEELSDLQDASINACFERCYNQKLESSLFEECIKACFNEKTTNWIVDNALKIHNKLRKAIDEENSPSHEGQKYSIAFKRLYKIFICSIANKMTVIEDSFNPLLKLQGENGELISDNFEFSNDSYHNKISLPKLKSTSASKKSLKYFCPSCGVSIDKAFAINGRIGNRTTVAHNIFSQDSWEKGCKKLLWETLKMFEKDYLDSDALITKNTKFIMCDPFAQSGKGNTQCQACETLQKNYDLAVRVHWARKALSLDVGEQNKEAWYDTITRFVGMQFIAYAKFFTIAEQDSVIKNFPNCLDNLVEKLHSEIINKAQYLIEVKLYKNIIIRLNSESKIQINKNTEIESKREELINQLKELLAKENKSFDKNQITNIYQSSMRNIIQKNIDSIENGVCIIKELITEMSFGVFRNRDIVSIEDLISDTSPKYTFKNLKIFNDISSRNKNISDILGYVNVKEFRNDFPGYKFIPTIFTSRKNQNPKFRIAKKDNNNDEWEFLEIPTTQFKSYTDKEKFIFDWADNSEIAFFKN